MIAWVTATHGPRRLTVQTSCKGFGRKHSIEHANQRIQKCFDERGMHVHFVEVVWFRVRSRATTNGTEPNPSVSAGSIQEQALVLAISNEIAVNEQVTSDLKRAANELGFELVGVCPAVTPSGYHRFLEWIELGYGGEMHYLADRAEAYRHPSGVLDGAKSIVMLVMSYHTEVDTPKEEANSDEKDAPAGTGKIARYAWGEVDYHDLIHRRLKQLKSRVGEWLPETSVRGVVDTAPLLEREFAQLAGLGWIGKNTLLLNKQYGSYFFLASLLLDVELDYDDPFDADHCGTCTACLDACPTNAFPQPYVMDARRCISYLTIEFRDEIPADLRGTWDDWLFGCDVCQEVCPWNRDIPLSSEPSFRRDNEAQPNSPLDLAELFYMDDDQFRERFRKTPLWRSKRRGILRNAALLLGSQKFEPATTALERGAQDSEPLVRESCVWALKQIRNTG